MQSLRLGVLLGQPKQTLLVLQSPARGVGCIKPIARTEAVQALRICKRMRDGLYLQGQVKDIRGVFLMTTAGFILAPASGVNITFLVDPIGLFVAPTVGSRRKETC